MDREIGCFSVITLLIVAGIAAVLIWAIRDDAKEQARNKACVGIIDNKYTGYDPGVNVVVGGGKNGGGTAIPVGNGTIYYFALRGETSTCERHVSKKTWLNNKEGGYYGG